MCRKLFMQTAAGSVAVAVVLTSCAPGATPPSDAGTLAAKVTELEAKVAYLSDRQQIHDVYLRYTRGFDRNDVELLQSAFWPDVQINYGRQSNSLDEFVVRHLKAHTKELASWGHLITNESVDISGDVAHVETYVTALFRPKDQSSKWPSTIGAGRYIDRLDRRNGEWRIAVREFIPHFRAKTNSTFDFAEQNWSPSACGLGAWDKRDPSYRRPLNRRPSEGVGPACAD